VNLFNVSDQVSDKPSRKLTFVLLFGPILLLTLSNLAYACTGSLQVVPASYQTELVTIILLSAFQRNFTSWRVSQTLCYVQHIHTLLCRLWSLVNQISIFMQSW